MTTPDEHARAYIAAQAVRNLTRELRGLELCKCGKEYAPGLSGRHNHKQVIGHPPVRDEKP